MIPFLYTLFFGIFFDMEFGYARISTDRERQNLAVQVEALKQHGVDERLIFTDEISGAKDTRPGLQGLWHQIKSGDTLVVWKLDRLGRSVSHLIRLLHEIRDKGVRLVSLTETIDTNSPQGHFFFHLIAMFAEFECSLLIERTNAGLNHARRQGKQLGRPVKIDEPTKQLIRDAVEAGHNKAAVARMFQISRKSVYDALGGC